MSSVRKHSRLGIRGPKNAKLLRELLFYTSVEADWIEYSIYFFVNDMEIKYQRPRDISISISDY